MLRINSVVDTLKLYLEDQVQDCFLHFNKN